MGDRCGEGSNQSSSRPRQDHYRSQESRRRRNRSLSRESRRCRDHSRSSGYVDWGSDSLEERRPYNVAMDAMSRTL